MPKIQADRLEEIGRALFIAAGTPKDEAELVMRHIVGANLVGHDSHGVIQVPTYIERIKVGHIVPGAPWTIVKESPNHTVIDGHWAFGYVANDKAMRLTIEKAEKGSVAAATVFRQGHIGRLSSYSHHVIESSYQTCPVMDAAEGFHLRIQRLVLRPIYWTCWIIWVSKKRRFSAIRRAVRLPSNSFSIIPSDANA